MNTGAIFLLQDDKTLVELRQDGFASEDLLQSLLADYPQLLAGELMNPTAPRRWVLVRREAGVPSEQSGTDRWSMDHLFLDQEGVPTIVEVKRSSDTRLRREVVGQMLDYAANAIVYWPVEHIRTMFFDTCKASGTDPDEAVLTLVSANLDQSEHVVEGFWENVERNLQAGRVRMVFVADVLPPELQRIVEFLNKQMKPAEVLAVEVRQYRGQGARTLVPRIFGLTAEAQIKKRGQAVQSTDEETFLSGLTSDYAQALREFFDFCRQSGLTVYWGAVGCSIRTTAEGRASPLSIAWVNRPDRAGWSGLKDVTLGFDRGSAEHNSPHLLTMLDTYVSRVATLPDAIAVTTKGMAACSFSPSNFVAVRGRIAEVIAEFGQALQKPSNEIA